mmetsp:Transcript_10386/g.26135  ORF Transcript_10386/g.26135 Transcript_10386/m.26135 type:complete len:343 (+) Transcript_10386:89-1117(+)
MYYDLNLPAAGTTAAKSSSVSMIRMLLRLGYDGCAFTHTVQNAPSPNDICTIAPVDMSVVLKAASLFDGGAEALRFPLPAPSRNSSSASSSSLSSASMTSSSGASSSSALTRSELRGRSFRQFTRLNIVLDDPHAFLSKARGAQNILESYDLLSVRPTNEKSFLAACTQIQTDIISLDISHRIPFVLRLPTVRLALGRGVRFELCYGRAIQEGGSSLRNYICNALSLMRATRGRNIMFASDVGDTIFLRNPADVMNLATLFGMNFGNAKRAFSSECESVIMHAETRRTRIAVASIEPAQESMDTEEIDSTATRNSHSSVSPSSTARKDSRRTSGQKRKRKKS